MPQFDDTFLVVAQSIEWVVMAIVPMSSPLPLNRRLAPMKNSVIRYSDVAHFVGLSLLHDPKLSQGRRKFKKEDVLSRSLQEDNADIDIQSMSSSMPNLHDRAELIRAKIRHLKVEQRSEKEHLKKLDHTLSETMMAEQKAHLRANRNRQERDRQKDHMRHVEERIKRLGDGRTPSAQRNLHATPTHIEQSRDIGESADFRRQVSSSSVATTRTGSKPLRASRSNLTLDSVGTPKPQVKELTLDILESFTSEAELTHYQREAVREYILANVGDPVKAFKLINVNGSGRISSMEFADGIEKLKIPWRSLTGLNKPSDFFRLFAAKKTGVVTFRDFFPAYEEPKEETGYDTPTFWEAYEKEDFIEGHDSEVDVPKWQWSCADEGLTVMKERERKDSEAAFIRKWMTTTTRRMKSQGKSDARCREMVALHLPKGTGPNDLHGVPTITEHDVKHLRQKYFDETKGPQRKCQQHIYDLHACRKDLTNSKHNFFHVVTEPILHKKLLEEQAKQAKSALGGLAGALIHKHDEPADFNDFRAEEEEEDEEELSVASEVADAVGELFEDATEHVSPLLSSQ